MTDEQIYTNGKNRASTEHTIINKTVNRVNTN